MKRLLVALVASWCGAASAQPVFFDDFDGPDLLPHWQAPDPSHWEYDISGGMLNVTGLFFPGIPHLGGNFAAIGALFEQQTDFRVDAWMGWEAGDDPHGLSVQVVAPGGLAIIAEFGYSDEQPGQDPLLIAGDVIATAPPPGMYQFTITRTGTQFDFFLDGEFFASKADRFGTPAAGIVFDLLGPNPPGVLGPLHVDRVKVVPAPGALVALGALSLTCARRRRT